ncbi:hypothetical protein [Streptomyces noursei]|uniref:hypothetical protein n=1 Tax=Streptomyces noursei TaxID=1971 RepID=UPI0021A57B59|nr:hypothetical protein [Streptomyces noursei]UWS77572.1 hypothetical protein N1H47_40910 [Streptomyces noursei]
MALDDKGERSALDIVYAVTDNLHIIPTRDDMFSLDDEMAGKRGRRRLWQAVQPFCASARDSHRL